MHGLSLKLKLSILVTALCLGATAGAARVIGDLYEHTLEGTGVANLRRAEDAFDGQERAEIEKLGSTLDALLANEDLREAFQAGDRDRLLALSAPLFATMKEHDRITHWYFISARERAVFLRVHKPELFGDRVERSTFQRALETGEVGAGKELGQTAFALRVVKPWYHRGEVIGYVELAEEIDHFLTAMKARTGDEYGILVKKRFLDEASWARVLGPRANTWNDRPDVVVVDTTTFNEGIIDYDGDLERLPDDGAFLGEADRGDRTYVRGIFPLRDAGGRKVGGLFVLHDFTAQHGALRASSLRTLFILTSVGLFLSLAIGLAVNRLVFARLSALRGRLEEAADAAGLPGSRVVAFPEDEVSGVEALLDRALFPAGRRDEPPHRAPSPAGHPGGAPASDGPAEPRQETGSRPS